MDFNYYHARFILYYFKSSGTTVKRKYKQYTSFKGNI